MTRAGCDIKTGIGKTTGNNGEIVLSLAGFILCMKRNTAGQNTPPRSAGKAQGRHRSGWGQAFIYTAGIYAEGLTAHAEGIPTGSDTAGSVRTLRAFYWTANSPHRFSKQSI